MFCTSQSILQNYRNAYLSAVSNGLQIPRVTNRSGWDQPHEDVSLQLVTLFSVFPLLRSYLQETVYCCCCFLYCHCYIYRAQNTAWHERKTQYMFVKYVSSPTLESQEEVKI